MNNKILPVCSVQKYCYDILGEGKAEVIIDSNPLHIPIAAVFSMAARKNSKRGFLFVSKIIGKHIPVQPLIPLLGGAALAQRYVNIVYGQTLYEQHCDFAQAFSDAASQQTCWEYIANHPLPLPERTLFIGFAETATALGHAIFACFADNARYIHTTREVVAGSRDVLDFVEEHSHAPDHRCYAVDSGLFDNNDRIILIDDELTTGKSALNFIRVIQRQYPRKQYAVLSILDWRSPEDRQRLAAVEQELGISIEVIALVSGRITISNSLVESCQEPKHKEKEIDKRQPLVETIILEKPLGAVKRFSAQAICGAADIVYLQATGRFGLTSAEQAELEMSFREAGLFLQRNRQGSRVLCLGTGEFMYIPFRIAQYMGEGVVVQSTTRSPIVPAERDGYGVKQAITFQNPEDLSQVNYVYNIEPGYYDEVYIFFEREIAPAQLRSLTTAFEAMAVPRLCLVFCTALQQLPVIPPPGPIGSYRPEDVTFLLKDVGDMLEEVATQDREVAIQSGRHYSEMLPLEYRPEPEYMALFHQTLQETAHKVALAAGIVAEQIVALKGSEIVLVSLARAGTPIGILIKRYLQARYQINLPHYSISIIRGKGVDENAILYIRQQHPEAVIQFIDGWTGKGAIATELIAACECFANKYGEKLDAALAVLADPGNCVSLYGTREDFLIPSACLNATVSGLVSRTIHRDDLIGRFDFHGAKFYQEWAHEDVSQLFIDAIARHFPSIASEAATTARERLSQLWPPTWEGLRKMKEIQEIFNVPNINLVKPGVGETTRVLLRRVPWKILVDNKNNPHLRHVLLLARDRGVPVVEFAGLGYSCCGLIKTMEVEDVILQ
jgi:hypothetical protein